MTINDKINHSDSAQMIATGIAGYCSRLRWINPGPTPIFGIIIALPRVLAKLSLLTGTIDGEFEYCIKT